MRVLVTGASGLLGTAVLRALQARGHEALEFEGDLTSAEDVRSATERICSADALIHTAAATDVNKCEKERDWCYAVNVGGTRAAAEMARALGARLVFISTVSVFDGFEGNYREADPPNPKNWYNVTKFAGEEIVRDVPDSLIVRLNLIGIHPGSGDVPMAIPRGRNFLEWLYGAIKNDEDLKLFTDVQINPLSNLTIADLLVELLEQRVSDRVLHLGTQNRVSKADIGRFLLERTPGYKGTVEYTTSDVLSALAHRPKEMWLNTERAAIVFGRALPSVEQELERILSNL